MAREPQKSRQNAGKSKNETGAKTNPNEGAASQQQGANSEGAAEFLTRQHQALQASLAKRSEADVDYPTVVKEFAVLWLPHQAVEAEILTPALRDFGWDQAKLAESEVRKDIINILLADLLQNEDDEFRAVKLDRMAGEVDALVEAASGENESPKAIDAAAAQFPSLNTQLATRYERMKQRFAQMDESIGEALVMLAPRRLSVSFNSQPSRREYQMSSRYSNMRERDDQGRFMSEDDHRGSSGGRGRDEEGRFTSEGGRSRGRYNDDDRDYRGSRGGPERDENGRFMSEGDRSRGRYNDDDRDYRGSRGGPERDENGRFMSEGGSRSRGRYDDEDERYGRGSMSRGRDDEGRFTRRGGGSEGRGHGGWFGDSEGHSEASRRGWESGSHGDSGWYGDREGHSEASRRGWENPNHGESGWYGDPEGHSEASRRGWEQGHEGNYRSRSSSRSDDDRRYESRGGSRYQDDERGGNGGRGGHSGWSGDPEGHSEASRRGWQNRR